VLQQIIKFGSIQNTPAQRSFDEIFKLAHIPTKQFRRLVVERVVRVGFVKEVNETVNDGINVQHGFPVLPQDIEAHLTLQINVWMVNACFAFDFGWCVGIVRWNGKGEMVRGAFPVTRVRCDNHVKRAEVVGVGERNVGYFAAVEFRNVCLLLENWGLVNGDCRSSSVDSKTDCNFSSNDFFEQETSQRSQRNKHTQ